MSESGNRPYSRSRRLSRQSENAATRRSHTTRQTGKILYGAQHANISSLDVDADDGAERGAHHARRFVIPPTGIAGRFSQGFIDARGQLGEGIDGGLDGRGDE